MRALSVSILICSGIWGQPSPYLKFPFEGNGETVGPLAASSAARDASGQGNHGIVSGTAALESVSGPGTVGRIGFRTTGTAGSITVTARPSTENQSFVWEAVLRFDGSQPSEVETILNRRDLDTIPAILYRNGTGRIQFDIHGTGGTRESVISSRPITRGEFVKITAALDWMAGAMILVVGSDIAGMTTAVRPAPLDATQTPRYIIGGLNATQQTCRCTIDDVSVAIGTPMLLRPEITATASAASGIPRLVPGGWASLYGRNLSPFTKRLWSGSDFRGAVQPVALNGVSVLVGGREAPLAYIDSGQLNILVPNDVSPGNTTVTVRTPLGTATAQAVVRKRDPALFLVAEGKYPAAVRPDGTLALKNGAIPGVQTAPALSGEILTLYGAGFGEGETPVPTAVTFQSVSRIVAPYSVRIGGRLLDPADVQFIGRVPLHIDQLNLRVPNLPPGDHAIVIEIEGFSSPETVLLTIGGN